MSHVEGGRRPADSHAAKCLHADCPQERSCQEKIQQVCACGHRKREIKCLAKSSDSIPNREPLECDTECLRSLRLQSIAEALGVDPERPVAGKDDYVYSDTTLDMFEQRTGWCGSQENEIRTFAVSQESRLRFKAMGRPSRTFIHMLAADLGLKSESQDPEPNRAVMVYKRDGRLPILPKITLAEASRARAEKFRAKLAEKQSEALTVTGSHSRETPQPSKLPKFFNTIAVKNVPFGMTLDELESLLAEALTSNPDLVFTSHFSENSSAYFRATHRSGMAPSSLQHLVTRIKNVAARVIDRHDPTAAVCMCTSDENFVVTHWDKETSIDGWEHVGGRQKPLGNRIPRDQSMAAVAAAAVMNNKNHADATTGSSNRSSKTLVLRRKAAAPNRFANRFILNEDDGDNEEGHDAGPNSTIPKEETTRLQAEDQNEGRTIVGEIEEDDERRSSDENLQSANNNIETEQPPLRRLEPSPYEHLRRFSSSIDDW
ncbi:FKBP12-associated 1 -like protein [Ceratocystis lukuohia]